MPNRFPNFVYHVHISHQDTVRGLHYTIRMSELDVPDVEGKFDFETTRQMLELSRQRAKKRKPEYALIRQQGEELFKLLFGGNLSYDFISYYRMIMKENQLLRLELKIDERHVPGAASLPWEAMCIPEEKNLGETWLGIHPNLAFVRCGMGRGIEDKFQLEEDEALRIALVVSAPKKIGGEERPVEYKRIEENIINSLNGHHRKFEIYKLAEKATLTAISDVLKAKPHVFHFIGHAQLKDKSDKVTADVLLEDTLSNREKRVNARLFSSLLDRHHPRIVVLQACESGRHSAIRPYAGIITEVLKKNVPVVVGMQYEIMNATAQTFAIAFYKHLAENDAVEMAVQEGRHAIAYDENAYQFSDLAIPIIYSHVKDGRLFPLTEGTDQASPASALEYYEKMRQIYELLRTDHQLFCERDLLGQDQCEKIIEHTRSFLIIIQRLTESLGHSSKRIPSYELIIELNEFILYINEILSKLKDFSNVCPRSIYYKGGSEYRNEHKNMESRLGILLDRLNNVDRLLMNYFDQ